MIKKKQPCTPDISSPLTYWMFNSTYFPQNRKSACLNYPHTFLYCSFVLLTWESKVYPGLVEVLRVGSPLFPCLSMSHHMFCIFLCCYALREVFNCCLFTNYCKKKGELNTAFGSVTCWTRMDKKGELTILATWRFLVFNSQISSCKGWETLP